MYFIFSGKGKYASVAATIRNGSKTSVSSHYLGYVVDLEKGIFQNKERGFFTFDIKTGMYGTLPESYVPPEKTDGRKKAQQTTSIIKTMKFGDVFLTNAFLHEIGFFDVVDAIDYGNPDTLHAMLLYYMLSDKPNYDVRTWYEGSIVSLLYPKANLTSQRISDFLKSIGTFEKSVAFQKAYIEYIFGKYGKGRNILSDSTALCENEHAPLTSINICSAETKTSNEVRGIYVVQKSTGIPLLFKDIQDNILEASILEWIYQYMEFFGLDMDSCILDAEYNTDSDLDLFYDESHRCKIDFMIRVSKNDKELQQFLSEELDEIDQKENLVKYKDQYFFIAKKQIFTGSNHDNPAWLYVGLECDKVVDEVRRLWKNAESNSMILEYVMDAMQNMGLFFFVTGKEYSRETILPVYSQKQNIEQTFDSLKKNTKLLPPRTHSEEIMHGHLLLEYAVSCGIRLMQLRSNYTDDRLDSRLFCLNNQGCTVSETEVLIDIPSSQASEVYDAFQIASPRKLQILDGVLQYTAPITASNTVPESGNKEKTGPKAKQETIEFPANIHHEQRKRGRPPGSRNKTKAMQEKTSADGISEIESTAVAASTSASTSAAASATTSISKRPRGRPPGSRNKSRVIQGKTPEDDKQ